MNAKDKEYVKSLPLDEKEELIGQLDSTLDRLNSLLDQPIPAKVHALNARQDQIAAEMRDDPELKKRIEDEFGTSIEDLTGEESPEL